MINIHKLLQQSLIVFISFISAQVQAHEFWLEPVQFTVAEGKNIQAHLKVGRDMKGEMLGFMMADFQHFAMTLGQKSTAINSRFGAYPAVSQQPIGSGLHLLSYVSSPSTITFTEADTFNHYLEKEGLHWVKNAHQQRQLPSTGFIEAYQRFAKALVGSGNAAGSDYALGLEFEWVLNTNPYTKSTQNILATLYFQQQPFPGATTKIFNRHNGQLIQQTLITDSNGQISIQRSNGGVFMISAVHMIEPTAELTTTTGAVWHSLWASTCFKIIPSLNEAEATAPVLAH